MTEIPGMDLAAALAAINEAERRSRETLAEMREERKAWQLAKKEFEDTVADTALKIVAAHFKLYQDTALERLSKQLEETLAAIDKRIAVYFRESLGEDAYHELVTRSTVPDAFRKAHHV